MPMGLQEILKGKLPDDEKEEFDKQSSLLQAIFEEIICGKEGLTIAFPQPPGEPYKISGNIIFEKVDDLKTLQEYNIYKDEDFWEGSEDGWKGIEFKSNEMEEVVNFIFENIVEEGKERNIDDYFWTAPKYKKGKNYTILRATNAGRDRMQAIIGAYQELVFPGPKKKVITKEVIEKLDSVSPTDEEKYAAPPVPDSNKPTKATEPKEEPKTPKINIEKLSPSGTPSENIPGSASEAPEYDSFETFEEEIKTFGEETTDSEIFEITEGIKNAISEEVTGGPSGEPTPSSDPVMTYINTFANKIDNAISAIKEAINQYDSVNLNIGDLNLGITFDKELIQDKHSMVELNIVKEALQPFENRLDGYVEAITTAYESKVERYKQYQSFIDNLSTKVEELSNTLEARFGRGATPASETAIA